MLDEKVFLPLKLETVRQSRKEVGCIAYELFKNADEKASDNYAILEIWRTSEDELMRMPASRFWIILVPCNRD